MKICILGTGNAAKATAAYVMQQGHNAVLYSRSAEKAALLAEKGIDATGVVEGHFAPEATADIKAAVSGAKLILVQTVAQGHADAAESMKGLLEPDQIILVFNGNWGAATFACILGDEATEKNVAICETDVQLILSSSPAPTAVYAKTVKKSLQTSCADKSKLEYALSVLNPLFPQLKAGGSILETTLNGSNPIVHGPMTAYNITRMENGEEYAMFTVSISPMMAEYITRADGERCAVAAACGITPISSLDLMNKVWPKKRETLSECLRDNPAYADTLGPKTLNHRYINEDLPYGIGPMVRLSRRFGLSTPHLDNVITTIGLFLERDFTKEGPSDAILEYSLKTI